MRVLVSIENRRIYLNRLDQAFDVFGKPMTMCLPTEEILNVCCRYGITDRPRSPITSRPYYDGTAGGYPIGRRGFLSLQGVGNGGFSHVGDIDVPIDIDINSVVIALCGIPGFFLKDH